MNVDIERALDFMRDNAEATAGAKANRVYLEQYRKTLKATLMKRAEGEGYKTTAAQEREAYASDEYKELLDGLRVAVEEEERLRWLMVAAQTKTEVWRSLEASNRRIDRGHQ